MGDRRVVFAAAVCAVALGVAWMALMFLGGDDDEVVLDAAPPVETTTSEAFEPPRPTTGGEPGEGPVACERVGDGVDCEAGVPVGKRVLVDVFRPPSDEPLPVAILVHGGGWVGGDREEMVGVARTLTAEGIAAVSVGYTTGEQEGLLELQVEDLQETLAWVEEEAAELGFDPAAISLVGSSAGAHLVQLVAALTPEAELRSVVSFSGPTDLPSLARGEGRGRDDDRVRRTTARFLGCELEECPERYRAASPITHARPGLPRVLLVNSEAESIPASQATAMAEALSAVGAPVELILVPGTGHGKGLSTLERVEGRFLAHLLGAS